LTDFKIIIDPEKYGYEECPHCHGFGSSLEDPEGVNICTKCEGDGVVKKDE
jgi:DnaJ-class molecular chaperone